MNPSDSGFLCGSAAAPFLDLPGCPRGRPIWTMTEHLVESDNSQITHIRMDGWPSTMCHHSTPPPYLTRHLASQSSPWPDRLLCPARCLSLITCADHHRHTELGKSSMRGKKNPPGCSCHNPLTKPPLVQSDIQVIHWESSKVSETSHPGLC